MLHSGRPAQSLDERVTVTSKHNLQGLRNLCLLWSLQSIEVAFIKQTLHLRRLQTESGESVGPHRVWLGNVWLPGLAMSRAMGDTMARRCSLSRCMHSCCGNLLSSVAMHPQRCCQGSKRGRHQEDGDFIVTVINELALCRAGVISEPEFCFVDLASDDETLILASDGVFEFMSDEEVVDIVCNGNAADAEEACSQVRWLGFKH